MFCLSFCICFKITHCGICYAEVVWLFNHLGHSLVPGHEMVGVVIQVGSNGSLLGRRLLQQVKIELCSSSAVCWNYMYNPMKRYGMTTPGKHLGVIGMGGLAVKLGKSFGLKVTVSPGKKEEAVGVLGADSLLVTTDAEALKAARLEM